MRRTLFPSRALAVSLFLFAALCPAQQQPNRDTYLRLATEVDNALHNDVLAVWFPRSM
jgi:hypothetical protein